LAAYHALNVASNVTSFSNNYSDTMTIIVYSSNTGSTKSYAQAFSGKVGYACFDSSEEYDRQQDIIYFGWMNGPKVVGLDNIDQTKLKAVVTVSIECDDEFFQKIGKANDIKVPIFHLRGWIDRSKLGFGPKFLFFFICMMYKYNGLNDYTGPMYDAMKHGGSFYDESGLDPIIEFVKE